MAERKNLFSNKQFEKIKQYVGQVCGGRNKNSDGCTALSSQIGVEFEIAEDFTRSIEASKECESISKVVGRGRGAKTVTEEKCKLFLTDIDSGSFVVIDYADSDIDSIISGINSGVLRVPDIRKVNIDDIKKQFNATKCQSIKTDKPYDELQNIIANKCYAGAQTPSSTGGPASN